MLLVVENFNLVYTCEDFCRIHVQARVFRLCVSLSVPFTMVSKNQKASLKTLNPISHLKLPDFRITPYRENGYSDLRFQANLASLYIQSRMFQANTERSFFFFTMQHCRTQRSPLLCYWLRLPY